MDIVASHRGKDLLWMFVHITNTFRVVCICVCERAWLTQSSET